MNETTKTAVDTAPLSLSLPPVEELAVQVQKQLPAEKPEDPELKVMADQFIKDILSQKDADAPERQRQAVDTMGIEVQRQAAHRSVMLQTQVRKLAHQGDEGGPVAKALLDLRSQMQDLDPNRQNLKDNVLSRIFSFLPGVGSKLQRYFHKFETSQEALDAIIRDLEAGREMLRRDNLTLADDQNALRETLGQLRRQIDLGRMIDRRMEDEINKLPEGDAKKNFMQEELLFPLRQRILDLQQQLTVSQQGILALEVVIRNNRELMRGVDRSINVTVAALNIAVVVAMALANQRLVLDRVKSINTTTSDLIAGTSQALRTQGVEIQTQASSAMLDMEKLEKAFGDVIGAIDEVSRYRREALPKLDEQIDRLEDLASQGENAIRNMDEGNQIRATHTLQ